MAQSVQIKKVSPWMERLADLLIAHPEKRMMEIAKMMGRTYVWVSSVRNSDTFKDYWRMRSENHSDAVTLGIKEKSFAAAEMALDNILEKAASHADAGILTIQQSLDIFDMTMKRFAPNTLDPDVKSGSTTINNYVGLVSPEQLATAREKLRKSDEPVISLIEQKKAS